MLLVCTFFLFRFYYIGKDCLKISQSQQPQFLLKVGPLAHIKGSTVKNGEKHKRKKYSQQVEYRLLTLVTVKIIMIRPILAFVGLVDFSLATMHEVPVRMVSTFATLKNTLRPIYLCFLSSMWWSQVMIAVCSGKSGKIACDFGGDRGFLDHPEWVCTSTYCA